MTHGNVAVNLKKQGAFLSGLCSFIFALAQTSPLNISWKLLANLKYWGWITGYMQDVLISLLTECKISLLTECKLKRDRAGFHVSVVLLHGVFITENLTDCHLTRHQISAM